jgi:hypothetical protein
MWAGSKIVRAIVSAPCVFLSVFSSGQTQTTGRIAGTVRDAQDALEKALAADGDLSDAPVDGKVQGIPREGFCDSGAGNSEEPLNSIPTML